LDPGKTEKGGKTSTCLPDGETGKRMGRGKDKEGGIWPLLSSDGWRGKYHHQTLKGDIDLKKEKEANWLELKGGVSLED